MTVDGGAVSISVIVTVDTALSVTIDGAAVWVSVVVRYTTVASRTVETGETVILSTTVVVSMTEM